MRRAINAALCIIPTAVLLFAVAMLAMLPPFDPTVPPGM